MESEVHDPMSGRSPYQSPDAVLAEARRIAADIRRRAEREANAVRREAAEWASATRREAERHREQILSELEYAMASVPDEPSAEPEPGPEPEVPAPFAEDHGETSSAPVIDLRSAAEARGTPMPAVGRTYVLGHRPPPVETSIETKVHDVVRATVRRTFDRRFP